jgi:hypothetical protein
MIEFLLYFVVVGGLFAVLARTLYRILRFQYIQNERERLSIIREEENFRKRVRESMLQRKDFNPPNITSSRQIEGIISGSYTPPRHSLWSSKYYY